MPKSILGNLFVNEYSYFQVIGKAVLIYKIKVDL